MESLGFVLVYFLRGELPWMGLKAVDKQDKYEKIKNLKVSITAEELC